MSIIDSKQVINYLSDWLKDYLTIAGKSRYIILGCASPETIVIQHLCTKARIPSELCSIDDNNAMKDILYIIDYAKNHNGLIASNINRNAYRLIRSYYKFFNVDIAPTADLYRSEMVTLFKSIATNDSEDFDARMLHKEQPKANASWQYTEWADREDLHSRIIINDINPATNKYWSVYNIEQKRLIAHMHQLEKQTRHKINPNLPMPLRTTMPGLKV